MNPLQRIEQEVLVAGQEWTRLELQRRLPVPSSRRNFWM